MKINRGRVREGDVPPPARSAEAFGGRALSDTDYLSSLKLGRKTKKWRQIMVGGGSGMEQNVFELMVVVRFGQVP